MKKVLALVMSLVLVIGIVCAFASCGGSKESIVVGYTIYAPMNYLDEDGNLIGYDAELDGAQVVAKPRLWLSTRLAIRRLSVSL